MVEIIKSIQEEELNSERYKMVSDIVNIYDKRKYKDIEEKLLGIIRNYDYNNTSIESVIEKVNEYNIFFSSIESDVCNNNILIKKIADFNSFISSQLRSLMVELDLILSSHREQKKFDYEFFINVNLPKIIMEQIPKNICIIKNVIINGEDKYIQILPRENRKIYDLYNEFSEKVNDIFKFVLFSKINSVTLPLNLICKDINMNNDKIIINFYRSHNNKIDYDELIDESTLCINSLLVNGLTSKEERDNNYQKKLKLLDSNIILN